MIVKILSLDRRRGWRLHRLRSGMLHVAGDSAAAAAVAPLLDAGVLPQACTLAAALARVRGFWAILFEGEAGTVAAVDHVRSLPIFYAERDGTTSIGDDAHAVSSAAGANALDPIGAEEVALSGYTLGP